MGLLSISSSDGGWEVPNPSLTGGRPYYRLPSGRCVHAGIDEAGRGPVLGPLVVAGVAVPDPAALSGLGVKDSKRLPPAKRERLARLIRDLSGVRVEVRVLEPDELDARRASQTLNEIGLSMFQDIARALQADRLVVDAADVNAARFGARVQEAVPAATVVAEHKADDRHPEVAAASIIAKTVRDEAIETLRKRLERKLPMELGSGYPSDPKTTAFLQEWLRREGELPPGTRHSWETSKRLLAAAATLRLDAFD